MTMANQGETRDLWGKAFAIEPVESAPVVLLREQADLLKERTGGRIEGVILKNFEKGDGMVVTLCESPGPPRLHVQNVDRRASRERQP